MERLVVLLEELHPKPIPSFPLDDIVPELESFRDSIDELTRYHSGTGPAQKRYQLEQSFGQTLHAAYGWSGSYLAVAGNPDVDSPERFEIAGPADADPRAEPFRWEQIDSGTILFTYNEFKDPEGSFDGFLAELFQTARREGVEHLIIDLRRNEGGSSNFGDKLLAYLSPEPFVQLTRSEIRISEEIRAEFISYAPGFLRWIPLQYIHPLLRPLWTGEIGETATVEFDPVEQRDRSERFTGNSTGRIEPDHHVAQSPENLASDSDAALEFALGTMRE